jgi:hypothetical protein
MIEIYIPCMEKLPQRVRMSQVEIPQPSGDLSKLKIGVLFKYE